MSLPAHIHMTGTLLQDLYLWQQPRFSYCPYKEIGIQPVSVCGAGFSLETKELFLLFWKKKRFLKAHEWSARAENTWKVHVNVKIELRDFNPLEKAFLTT